jgi:UDP-galactose transporter B1
MQELIRMSLSHSDFLGGLILFGIAGSVGQFSVYYCLVHFGSLICTLITTTRKFFSILISVILFGHHLTGVQWFSIAVVFMGLGLDAVISNPRLISYWIQLLSSKKNESNKDL